MTFNNCTFQLNNATSVPSTLGVLAVPGHAANLSAPARRRKETKRSSPPAVFHAVSKRQTGLHRDARPSHRSNGEWPNWSDPLDFEEAPEEEAIARVNAAGYFVHTLDGHIYKINEGGSVTPQRLGSFNNVFTSRLARRDDGALISAGTAWRRSPDHCEYRQIGYWPDDHGRPAKSYNLWRG